MSDGSKIEWTDASWNCVTGCTKVSPGCDHCYAETFAERWRGIPGHHFENGFDITLRPERLEQPRRWKRPRRIFVNSMSDVFHEGVPDDFILQMFAVMAVTPQHQYQLLTKRHARMRSLLNRPQFADDLWALVWQLDGGIAWRRRYWPLRNVWLGVSAEDQKWADIRIPALLATPAAVRFVSAEPLLGPINLIGQGGDLVGAGIYALPDPPEHDDGAPVCQDHGSERCRECRFIDWVIVGGESGPSARPMDAEWARSIVRQCQDAQVPVFVKQLGSVLGRMLGAGPKGGDWDEWYDDLRIREFPRAAEAIPA
jgi:protein gp37